MIHLLLAARPAATQAPADTVVTVAAQTGLQAAADVGVLILAAGTIVLTVLFSMFLLNLKRVDAQMQGIRRKLLDGMDPIMERSANVAENVDFITRAVRTDVERLNRSVAQLNDRLEQASDRMEARIEEFNALMELVQDEAEGLFIDTASAVRGVRAGTRSLSRGESSGPRPGGEALPGGAVSDEE